MPVYHFNNVATDGIIKDLPAVSLPAGPDRFAWSDGQNIRIKDGSVQKIWGDVTIGSASATPIWGQGLDRVASLPYALVALNGQTNPRLYRGQSDLSLIAELTVTAFSPFSGGSFYANHEVIDGKFLVFNDGLSAPRYTSYAAASTTPVYLPWDASDTWDTIGGGRTARVIRRFGRYLLALAPSDLALNAIRWSTDMAAESVPTTWDDTDTGENAGFAVLDTPHPLVDFLPLRNDLGCLYTPFNTIAVRPTRDNSIFEFSELFSDRGLRHVYAVRQLEDKHIVVGADDIYWHDGVRAESILDNKHREEIFGFDGGGMHGSNSLRVYLALLYELNEMWLMYTTNAADYRMLIWNYKDNTFSLRDPPTTSNPLIMFPHLTHVSVLNTNNPRRQIIFGVNAGGAASSFNRANAAFLMNGSTYTSYVRRTGLDFGAPDRVKLCTRVWPKIEEVTTTGSMECRVGAHETPSGNVTWSDYKTFDPAITGELDFNVKGRYLAIDFRHTANGGFKLSGFSMDVDDAGRF